MLETGIVEEPLSRDLVVKRVVVPWKERRRHTVREPFIILLAKLTNPLVFRMEFLEGLEQGLQERLVRREEPTATVNRLADEKSRQFLLEIEILRVRDVVLNAAVNHFACLDDEFFTLRNVDIAVVPSPIEDCAR